MMREGGLSAWNGPRTRGVSPLRFDGSWLFPWFDIFALLHGVWRGAGCNHGWLMESLA